MDKQKEINKYITNLKKANKIKGKVISKGISILRKELNDEFNTPTVEDGMSLLGGKK